MEGSFELPDALRAELGERIPDDAEELVLARRVSAEGRTRAYLNGRSATAADLRDAGGALLSFYGQHEHRKLMLAAAQLEILDGFCGPEQAERREAFAAVHARERALLGELVALRERAGARDRELDLLEWELAEIDAAAPSECRGGRADRRARAAAQPRGAAPGRRRRDRGDRARERRGRRDARWRAQRGPWRRSAASTRRSTSLADRAGALAVEADDLAGELRRYGEAVDAPPGRLDEVEERLALFERLKRKHGGTIAAVLAHAEACRARRDELAGAEEALEDATAALEAVRAELARRAEDLRDARGRAAGGPVGSGGRRARRAGDGRGELRGATDAARGLRAERRRRRRVPDRPEPGRPGRPAARDGIGRRALARDARADERRGRGRPGDARVRRGRRGHRRPDRARRRRSAARAGRGAAGDLHHPPAADRVDGRAPLHDRQGHVGRPGPRDA